MELHDRVAWALRLIKDQKRINNIQLAQKLGVNKNTAAAYTQGHGDLKGSALAAIVHEYNINGEWLLSGKGEPFPGAHEKYPEACVSPSVGDTNVKYIQYSVRQTAVKECAQSYNNKDYLFSSDQKINIDEAIGKAYKVLTAGTALSVALYMNIQQFAAALDTGRDLTACQEQIVNLQDQINNLKLQVDRLSAAPSGAERQGDGSANQAT